MNSNHRHSGRTCGFGDRIEPRAARHGCRVCGFTLVELLITVVIVGILSALAYPSYTNWVKSAKRSDAKVALLDLAARQEKFYSDCGWYAGAINASKASQTCGADATAGVVWASTQSQFGTDKYTLSVAAGNIAGNCTGGSASFACGFTLTATTTGAQAGDGNLRIDALAARQWDKANNSSWSAGWTDK